MSAGNRDQLITIQRATTTTDDYGAEVPTWATYAIEWAAVFFGRGDERRAAAVEQGSQAATFQVLSNSKTLGVTLKDRIQHLGSVWDVKSIAPDTPRRGEIEIEGVRSL